MYLYKFVYLYIPPVILSRRKNTCYVCPEFFALNPHYVGMSHPRYEGVSSLFRFSGLWGYQWRGMKNKPSEYLWFNPANILGSTPILFELSQRTTWKLKIYCRFHREDNCLHLHLFTPTFFQECKHVCYLNGRSRNSWDRWCIEESYERICSIVPHKLCQSSRILHIC